MEEKGEEPQKIEAPRLTKLEGWDYLTNIMDSLPNLKYMIQDYGAEEPMMPRRRRGVGRILDWG